MDVDLRLLRSFEAVADELHFGRAARRMFLSQPSLSRAVRDLERALGVELFSRTSREVRLTPAGEALQEELPRLFAQLEHVLTRAQRVGRGETGELRVAFLASATNVLLPAVLRTFREAFPAIGLSLDEMLDDTALAGVLARRFDVALVRTRRPEPELDFAELAREPLCLVVSADHRLARRRRARYEDLREDSLILWPRVDAPESFDDIIEGCRRAGFSPSVVQEASGAYTILALVSAGLGVSVLAASYEALRGRDLVFVPLVGRRTVLYAAWRTDDASVARRNFVDVARSVSRRIRTHPPPATSELNETQRAFPCEARSASSRSTSSRSRGPMSA
jgi:DNA-binding transcriptional LysR family regulator